MRALVIDTCFASCSAAVIDVASSLVIGADRQLMERGHAETIAPMVQAVLARTDTRAQNLSCVAVTIGPGTFTGVRIGLALAQGIGLASGTSLIGIDTMLATAAPLLGRSKPIHVVHKAGATGQVYAQQFDAGGAPLGQIGLMRTEDVNVTDDAILVGTGAELITGSYSRETAFDLPDAARFAARAILLPAALKTLQPLYIREPDAKPQSLSGISIGRVGSDFSDALAEVHGSSFTTGWSSGDIASMLSSAGTVALLASSGDRPVGMVLLRAMGDEAEVLTLATVPQFRKRGVAKRMIQSAESYLVALNVSAVHLEVAADNDAAIGLYVAAGFRQSGLRKGYYVRGATRIDAILMRWDI